jgi:hypothetical protein
MPSTGPALKPWSFRACWTCDTFELSFADDEDDCDEEEDGAEDCDDEDDGEEDCDELIAGVWL